MRDPNGSRPPPEISPGGGLRVAPALRQRLSGPKAGRWRGVIAALLALFAGIAVANLSLPELAPGSAFLSGLVCPVGQRLERVPAEALLAAGESGLRLRRGPWLGCRDPSGSILRSRLPHEKLITYGTYASGILLFLPVWLCVDRALKGLPPAANPAETAGPGPAMSGGKRQRPSGKAGRRRRSRR